MDSQNVLESVFLAEFPLYSLSSEIIWYTYSQSITHCLRENKVWVTQRQNSSQCWEGFGVLISLTWKWLVFKELVFAYFTIHPGWNDQHSFFFNWKNWLFWMPLSGASALDPVFDSEVPWTMHYFPPSRQPKTEQESIICHFVVAICMSYIISCSPWLIFIMWY